MRSRILQLGHVNIHPRGDIIVSTPNNDTVALYDKACNLLSTFPSQFLAIPQGICADNSGRVFVADQQQAAVLMFTKEGHFIQTVVQEQNQLRSISSIDVLNDEYLVIGTHRHGLFLYKLIWV